MLPVANQGLQPRFIVSPLSYHPGRPGAGGGMAGETNRPRSPPLRRHRPRPELQLPWRAGVAYFSPRRPDRGGVGAAGLMMRPPTRRSVHGCRCMYAHMTWRGTRGWRRRKVAVMGCGRAAIIVSSPRSKQWVYLPHRDIRSLSNRSPRA